MKRRYEPATLQEVLFHLVPSQKYLREGTLENTLVLDGVCMRLSSAIEAISRLDDHRPEELFGDEWHKMWGTRNRIAHGYAWVDSGIIAEAIEQNVPNIIAIVRRELGNE